MSKASDFFVGGAGAPIGTIVSGYVNDPDWLPLDGTVYNKADYPDLDTSCMLTTGSNAFVTRQTLSAQGMAFAVTPSTILCYPNSAASATYYSSSDNGVTWISRTFAGGNFSGSWSIAVANGVFFAISTSTTPTFYTSTDGIAWVSRSLPLARSLSAVGYVNGVYVLTQYSYGAVSAFYAFRSTDLTTWTTVALPIYTPSAEAAVFYPENISLITHPVHGLLFSGSTSSAYVWAYRTKDGINYTAETCINTDGAERRVNGFTGSGGVQYDDNYRVVFSHGPGNGASYIGSSPGNLRPTGRGMYFRHISKNLGVLTNYGSNTATALSETGGSTSKVLIPSNVSTFCRQGNRIFFYSAAEGLVRSIDIDSTKFVATKGVVDYDEPAENLYIKAR